MEEGTLIQILLPKEFNYELDIYIAGLKRDRKIQEEGKTKAQIIMELARTQLHQKNTR